MVSVNSIFTTYVCSPLSDLMRRVQTSGAEASASSAVFTLEVRKPRQLRSERSAGSRDCALPNRQSLWAARVIRTGERGFTFGNVLQMN